MTAKDEAFKIMCEAAECRNWDLANLALHWLTIFFEQPDKPKPETHKSQFVRV